MGIVTVLPAQHHLAQIAHRLLNQYVTAVGEQQGDGSVSENGSVLFYNNKVYQKLRIGNLEMISIVFPKLPCYRRPAWLALAVKRGGSSSPPFRRGKSPTTNGSTVAKRQRKRSG